MPLFTLEALQAKKGDSLLLHVGDPADPRLVVIDGGPSGVYRRSLLPRLQAIRRARTPDDALPIHLMMISHIDDDHIRGILDLTNRLVERRADREPEPFKIANLWHNSFDDIVGAQADALARTAAAEVGAASADGTFAGDRIRLPGGLVLASVRQGRDLRNNAGVLAVPLNLPGGDLIVAGETIEPPGVPGLELRVLGPSRERIEALQADWAEKVREILERETAGAEAAAYLDESVYNLASIVVLARVGGKSMLLTGDARGDDTLAAAREAGLLDADGRLHVDILKLPHHGSDRNVDLDYFQAFTADHYVASGNGEHGNPEVETFRLLFAGRRGDPRPFTLHLTYPPEEFRPDHGRPYPVAELEEVFAAERAAGTPFTVATPAPGEVSMKLDLLDPYTGP
jgi:hypothetical protein